MADLLQSLLIPNSNTISSAHPNTSAALPQSIKVEQQRTKRRRSISQPTMLSVQSMPGAERGSDAQLTSLYLGDPSFNASNMSGSRVSAPIFNASRLPTLEEYMSRAEIRALGNEPNNITKSSKTLKIYDEPLLLTSGNAEAVSELNHRCQKRGVTPTYTFTEVKAQCFSGTLSLSVLNRTIPDDDGKGPIGPFATKRDVKSALAARGIGLLDSKMDDSGKFEKVEVNYIGLLQENCQTLSSPLCLVPRYDIFETSHSLFAASCTLPEFPPAVLLDAPFMPPLFPCTAPGYPSKKLAKIAAAKEAYTWLIDNDVLVPPTQPSYIRARQVKRARHSDPRILLSYASSSSLSTANGSLNDTNLVSYGQLVNALCPRLGLPMPTYKIERVGVSQAIYSGGAVFGWSGGNEIHPAMDDRIRDSKLVGIVDKVLGIKNAREACSKGVWEVLREIEDDHAGDRKRQRTAAVGMNDESLVPEL